MKLPLFRLIIGRDMELLVIAGVDISHVRLVDLTLLADHARPFYQWVESKFQTVLQSPFTLDQILQTATLEQIRSGIGACYQGGAESDVPFLFDGVGRTYPHTRACYYFFSWLIRDAPQQRLSPLIQRIIRTSGNPRLDVEIDVLARLIVAYRDNVKTFSWEAVREVIIDRLEGSRRSIKGHEKETIVRTALLVAIQDYYDKHHTYGIYSAVEIPSHQVMIGNESYDVSANLLDKQGMLVHRILVPIKTRETEGGGHSHLFTRDILSAISAVKSVSATDYLIVVIVAQNWSSRETENLSRSADHLILFDISPSIFAAFDTESQIGLNRFIANVFDGVTLPKA